MEKAPVFAITLSSGKHTDQPNAAPANQAIAEGVERALARLRDGTVLAAASGTGH